MTCVGEFMLGPRVCSRSVCADSVVAPTASAPTSAETRTREWRMRGTDSQCDCSTALAASWPRAPHFRGSWSATLRWHATALVYHTQSSGGVPASPPARRLSELRVGHPAHGHARQCRGFRLGRGIAGSFGRRRQLATRGRFEIGIRPVDGIAHGAGGNQRHTTRRVLGRDIGDGHGVTDHGRRVGVEPERATGNRRSAAGREVQRGGPARPRGHAVPRT